MILLEIFKFQNVLKDIFTVYIFANFCVQNMKNFKESQFRQHHGY